MSFFQQAIEKNLSRCQAEECQQAFLALANGDPHGKIHPSQVEYGFQTLGFEITKEEVKELAKQLDRDQDDRLDWHDFQRLYLSKVLHKRAIVPYLTLSIESTTHRL